jgi:predicted nucleotidyltransferase component of viral defense system
MMLIENQFWTWSSALDFDLECLYQLDHHRRLHVPERSLSFSVASHRHHHHHHRHCDDRDCN